MNPPRRWISMKVERLFAVVRTLSRSIRIGVVFISHRIHELKAICDTLTVLRDGRLIESGPMGPLERRTDRRKMLGPRAERYLPRLPRPPHGEEVLLQVDGLHDEALLQDISLRLRKGKS